MSTEGGTLYGQWESLTYTVTFNGNGGTVSPSTITVDIGQPIGTLASASRSGYNFLGWFTATSGGTQIITSSILNKDTIVYAHWSNTCTIYINSVCSTKTWTISNGTTVYASSYISCPSNTPVFVRSSGITSSYTCANAETVEVNCCSTYCSCYGLTVK